MSELYEINSRRQGKWNGNLAMIKFALARRDSIIIGTSNQQGLIARLTDEFDGALFELVGTWGVKIHLRKK